jgi:1,4-alpha-glucan branching enzyme
MAKGYWMLVLHAHLPFVRHPEYTDAMEERWLFEAMSETYIPLLMMFERLVNEGVDFRVTMSITPPLANMLGDKLLQDRYERHIQKLIELAEKEIHRTRWLPEFHETSKMYLKHFKDALDVFYKYNRNLLNGFKMFQDLGKLEIITCSATHGYAPLMEMYPNAVRAQYLVAKRDYERVFGKSPRGVWNAECAYYPGLEEILKEAGIRFFFVDTHGILYADRRPKYGVFAPMYTRNGIAFFGRDVETSKSVWSAKEGYPGDPWYREFYRDLGYDADYDYIRPYIHESGIRLMTGIKYYRITGHDVPLDRKEPYNPQKAMERVWEHAGNFIFNRQKQIEWLSGMMDREPLIVSMYDAELFGHWWFEGPQFLYAVIKKCWESRNWETQVETISPMEYLQRYPKNQVATPPICSWGYKGYNEFWLSGPNDWIYRHLHKADEKMIELANKFKHTKDPLIERALNQMARELLLAQSSDWAFIMRTGTTVEYAVKRTKDHINRVFKIYEMVQSGHIDVEWLKYIEYLDNIFPEIDFRYYADPDK